MRLFVFFAIGMAVVAAEKPANTPQEQYPQGVDLPMKLDDQGGPKYPTFGTKEYFNFVFRTPNPPVQLAGPIRLADYVVDGRIELSLRSYIELVMANNTEIQIQKLLIEPQRNAITRAFSPFDPAVSAQFNTARSVTPSSTPFLEGAEIVSSLNQPSNLSYTQRFMSGTQLTAAYRYNRLSSNSVRRDINPSFNSAMDFQFLQPLLRNRGTQVNRLPILAARSRFRGSQFNMHDQVMRLVVTSENAYWDLIGARENLKVQEQALSLADTSLKRAQKELELGAISALEIFQPQAVYARAEIFVTQARYRLQQAEDALRRQISVDLDPDLRKLPIVLTEVVTPDDNRTFDREALVSEAMRHRPDLRVLQTNLDVDEYNIKVASNFLKPDLSLSGVYSTQGLGGTTILPGGGGVIPGGFGDSWSQMWGFNYPVYGFGLVLRLPIKDRAAAANYADAAVAKRTDALQLRRQEQAARLEVLNAVSQVENSRASVELARIAADLALKRVEAEQKRYDLGTITLFFLLSAQTDLTTAQSELVNNSVQYRRNQLNLLQRLGTLLEERGIMLN